MNHYFFVVILTALCNNFLFAQTTNYTYDNLYRLTSVKYPNGSTIAYSYDANGNRIQEVYNTANVACPNGTISYSASTASASTYQWQENSGSGYVNISNSGVFGGVNTSTLTLTSPPTSWYGKKYRCFINGSSYSEEFTLKFYSSWQGSANNNWHNAANWSCGVVPDEFTDVYISTEAPNYPSVSSTADCRSLLLQPGATVNVSPGVNLNVKGK